MAKKALPLRIDEGLLARVDERRGVLGQTRTLFVERALERALGAGDRVPERAVPTPSRAPDPSVPIRHEDTRVGRAMSRADGIPVEPVGVGWCPKATCQLSGPLGEACPAHPNMRFKARP